MLNPVSNIRNYKNISFCAKNLHTKKVEDLTFSEKIELLRAYGLSKEEILKISKEDNRYINQFIMAKRYGANKTVAFEFANFSAEDFKKAQDLITQEAEIGCISEILKLTKQQSAKMEYLIKKKIDTTIALEISKLDDKAFEKATRLLKKGIEESSILHLIRLPENECEQSVALLRMGMPRYQIDLINKPTNVSSGINEKILSLMQKGIKYPTARLCINNPTYDDFLKKGYSTTTSAILTHLKEYENISDDEAKLSADIIRVIERNSQKSKDFTGNLIDFIEDCLAQNYDLEDLYSYVSKINFDKLKQIAPQMVKYTSEQLIKFLQWHYENYTQNFDTSTLDLGDLTKHLQENYLKKVDLDTLLTAHPLTRREVGEIPQKWLDKTQDKDKATKQIYKAIKDFQGRKDIDKLAQNLSQILNTKVKVEKIGQGAFGFTYKITVQNCPPVCLKIFIRSSRNDFALGHGPKQEIQTGLFLNRHSNDYVQVLFGKVETQYTKDGFLVTQFLDGTTTQLRKKNILSNCNIRYYDDRDANKINNTIIDFGGVEIIST